MEKKIVKRVGVFETNSSSCHSIVYNGKEGGKVNPRTTYGRGEYGWWYDTLFSPSDKLDYIIVMVGQYYGNIQDKYLQNIINVLRRKENKDFILKIQNGDYRNFDNISIEGIKIIENKDESDGYIDHQSAETLDEIFESNDIEKAIEDFLYGTATLIIDNDNH